MQYESLTDQVVVDTVPLVELHFETLLHVIDSEIMFLYRLLSRDVIDQPMIERLQSIPTNWDRNTILVEYFIAQCHNVRWGARFLACLRDDGQEHVANLLNGSKGLQT